MLAVQNRQLNSIFERIVKDKNGAVVRVRFIVVEINGVFQGQIVSITPVVSKEVLYLPCPKTKDLSAPATVYKSASKVSPYFSLDFLINSQPTRAPSFVK